jgi:hypothetical protein
MNASGETAIMFKWIFWIFVLLWLCCGLAAAHWLGDHRWSIILWGPASLAEAYNDNPMSYPGP